MSKSGSSKKETKNAEADTKSEADIKGNSSYSSTSTSKTPYCSLQDPERSPDYFKALTEKTNKFHRKTKTFTTAISYCENYNLE